jgi:hypothetical protein
MFGHFSFVLFSVIAHALAVHGLAETIRRLIGLIVPRVPEPICICLALVLAAILVEITMALWHRYRRSRHRR